MVIEKLKVLFAQYSSKLNHSWYVKNLNTEPKLETIEASDYLISDLHCGTQFSRAKLLHAGTPVRSRTAPVRYRISDVHAQDVAIPRRHARATPAALQTTERTRLPYSCSLSLDINIAIGAFSFLSRSSTYIRTLPGEDLRSPSVPETRQEIRGHRTLSWLTADFACCCCIGLLVLLYIMGGY